MNFISNPQLDLAFDYVRKTNKNIYLTGKAGTGKTTFLHKIKEEGFKRLVVTAPTGVAAINAGGMTLHSFFQLPFGMHLPGASRDTTNQRRFSGQKVRLIRNLDLLVIDEISMVRADLLDAVDDVLRRYRNPSQPFGGVQLLMIGDLHQLPPVVKPDEWELLRPHYQTPYFFGSLALQRTDMVAIELKHIFRQSDSRFIELLNNVRDNRIDAAVLESLNSRYIPGFKPDEDAGYITLTSHNASAHDLNVQRLQSLAERPRTFKAKIEGNFPEGAYPTEVALEFKKGAQVMFVKNDLSPEKRFFNGKIGTITRFGGDEIFVHCKDDEDEIAVGPVEWHNIKYTLDEQTKEITEERLGTFTQYPLKLAWAITIHKSQGLTFDRAIIDARAAFAHGQVYVALSRCRSFEGIVLSSKITLSSVKTDSAVKAYSEETQRNAPDEAHLQRSKREYQEALARELFSFRDMNRHLQQLAQLFRQNGNALSPEGLSRFKALAAAAAADVFAVSDKFLPQLQTYFSQADLPEQNENLRQRLEKAAAYFLPKLQTELLPGLTSLDLVTDDKAVLKTAEDLLHNLQREIFTKRACFEACRSGFSTFRYVRAKTGAELDFLTARRTAATTEDTAMPSVPKDTPHPELYAQLLHWRSETAEEHGMNPRQVLRTRSLRELVQFLPTSIASLKQIHRVGDVTIRSFGAAIVGMISAYCDDNDIAASSLPSSEPVRAPVVNTKQVTYDLYKSGKSIEEIAAERGLKTVTIEGHLAHFIGSGHLDISKFLTDDQVEEIAAFFKESGNSTTEAKAAFGDEYSFGELKMVQEFLRNRSL
jgi:hypothetical protein